MSRFRLASADCGCRPGFSRKRPCLGRCSPNLEASESFGHVVHMRPTHRAREVRGSHRIQPVAQSQERVTHETVPCPACTGHRDTSERERERARGSMRRAGRQAQPRGRPSVARRQKPETDVCGNDTKRNICLCLQAFRAGLTASENHSKALYRGRARGEIRFQKTDVNRNRSRRHGAVRRSPPWPFRDPAAPNKNDFLKSVTSRNGDGVGISRYIGTSEQ